MQTNNMEYINIVMGSCKENAVFSLVTLKSLVYNNSKNNFRVFYYHDGLSIDDLEKIKEVIGIEKNILIPMFISDDKKKELSIGDKTWWHEAVWYRYYCIEDLSEDIERVLLLGTDTLIQGNIEEFYNMDMNGKGIVSITDMGKFYDYVSIDIKKYGISKKDYINPDVSLLNLKQLKNVITVKKMVKICSKNDLWTLDQEVLSFFFQDYIYALNDMRYNFIPVVAEKMFEKEKYIEDLKKAIIIHYAVKKPWNEYDANCAHDLWFSYAEKTPYYEEILKSSIKASGKAIFDFKKKTKNLEYELRKHIFKMDKLYWIQDLLWEACDNEIIVDKLKRLDIKNIAIYGYGKIGKHLLNYCNYEKIEVSYIIDSCKKGDSNGIPIIRQEEIDKYKNVDAVIVTPIYDFEEIKKNPIWEGRRIISLEEIVK